MAEPVRVGMIGLDTSHVVAFTKLLNDPAQEYHVPGARVMVAYPGGSPDFELSWRRVDGFTRELRDSYGIEILDSPESVAERSDAILLESVDGRVHREQFARIAPLARPTFIDKPLATTSADARAIADLARQHNVPLMSCSSLRFSETLQHALQTADPGQTFGSDCYGPLPVEPTQPGLFWYGIHTVEMLYAAMGTGCEQVTAVTSADHDLIVGRWRDGRIGSLRGNRAGSNGFGCLLHGPGGTQYADSSADKKPPYASMLERVLAMFATGRPAVPVEETLEIIRFIEAANASRETGQPVRL